CGRNPDGSRYVDGETSDALITVSALQLRSADYLCSDQSFRVAPNWYLAVSGIDTGWYWQTYDAAGASTAPLIGYYIGRTSQPLGAILSGPGLYSDPTHFAANHTPALGVTNFAYFRGPDGRSTPRTRR